MSASAAAIHPAVRSNSAIAKHPTISATGLQGYLQWLKSDPQLAAVYEKVKPQIAQLIGAPGALSGLFGFGACCGLMCSCVQAYATCATASDTVTQAAPTAASPAASNTASSIGSMIQSAAQGLVAATNVATAIQASNTQLARAKAGLPPLNLSSYGISTNPSLSFGLSGSTLGTFVLIAGAGLLVWLMVAKK